MTQGWEPGDCAVGFITEKEYNAKKGDKMNETTKRNFFEIMKMAQKYHNANMTGQDIGERETDADALRVIELCAEIRRDNGLTGQQAVTDSLDAKHDLICAIADNAREYDQYVNYSEIGGNLSEQFDQWAREYASTAI